MHIALYASLFHNRNGIPYRKVEYALSYDKQEVAVMLDLAELNATPPSPPRTITRTVLVNCAYGAVTVEVRFGEAPSDDGQRGDMLSDMIAGQTVMTAYNEVIAQLHNFVSEHGGMSLGASGHFAEKVMAANGRRVRVALDLALNVEVAGHTLALFAETVLSQLFDNMASAVANPRLASPEAPAEASEVAPNTGFYL